MEAAVPLLRRLSTVLTDEHGGPPRLLRLIVIKAVGGDIGPTSVAAEYLGIHGALPHVLEVAVFSAYHRKLFWLEGFGFLKTVEEGGDGSEDGADPDMAAIPAGRLERHPHVRNI